MAGLFDKQSSIYAAARPDYPQSLYDFLLSITPPQRRLVWDAGTGNGQAAIALAKHFDRVVATDVSEEQLTQAPKRDNVTYAKAATSYEEVAPLLGGAADLVTVAQALHWFDDTFHVTTSRVLRGGGVVAAWAYTLCRVDERFDATLDEFYRVTSPYWAPQRAYVDDGYSTIPFPYVPAAGQATTGPFTFECKRSLDLPGMIMYLRSWSSIQTALDKGVDLLGQFEQQLVDAWGGDPLVVKEVTYPICLLAGTVV